MRPMGTLQDVIEEAKTRTLLWAICILAISYFLSHTSKSMWMNIPISVLILSAFRYLSYEVELRRRVRPSSRQTYLSHLEKKQLSVNDSRLTTVPPTSKWRRKIDSPPVQAAIDDFVNKILQDFVVDLWYSSITPDKEAPELIRIIILDVIGEISGRLKEINLVDLLTRDVVDLIGNHLDLYRKNQSEIGVDVMGTLSFEERDERLKRHLVVSKELHPALVSPECEHKFLQRIVGGILAVVMRPQEAKCPLARCISRELLTCLVLQPVMDLASPAYINELIECIFLASKDDSDREVEINNSPNAAGFVQDPLQSGGSGSKRAITSNQSTELTVTKSVGRTSEASHLNMLEKDSTCDVQSRPADWAMILEAATKRRSQVLAPENLEDMWTKGRNYKKKSLKAGTSLGTKKSAGIISSMDHAGCSGKELVINKNNSTVSERASEGGHFADGCEENASKFTKASSSQLKRSTSTPDINISLMGKAGENVGFKESTGELASRSEGFLHASKLRCRVVGAYFEKIGSKSFAVYSIAVTDAESKTWFVKRRYRNFERLHRHLKDIPNYSLHLPPKRFLSSSIDDYFVHQRCILLDKYLQDLLSIANVAEQHEVWDFLSVSSKNYSFGKSTSVMKTLAVNVDDAMDDIVRQFKGVSDGLRRVVGSSPTREPSQMADGGMTLPWHDEETNKNFSSYSNMETSHSMSDDDAQDEDHSSAGISGWHSDNELNSKSFPPRVVKQMEESRSLDSHRSQQPDQLDKFLASKSSVTRGLLEDPAGMPPEWTPPNVSVPLLNLVDKMFQLNRRGWLRRQVFWISKQILQLMMEDAIDDWILRQIHLLRNDEVIAHGIRWVYNVLWPNGIFFLKLRNMPAENVGRTSGDESVTPSSFQLQLEAARRASDVKKMILGGAPTTLVSLIGSSQYRKSAKDIYYFLQSTICVKQLAYSALELLVISVFPELRDLVQDIHDEKARKQSVHGK
ncbi:uncharacterized protein LOC109823779 isoform X1 [Asparagus officinalis]|uniref:uncharacterized protein LOC109823779 isoform X1 n=2 Tax=Asparagus officinalis TaxID=4686 RepID=UPI00098E22CC|nr:uncharacterized protein LOC109823779 isoform X1 [Asparagus officinalis]